MRKKRSGARRVTGAGGNFEGQWWLLNRMTAFQQFLADAWNA
jgi:hypothetical protein